MADKMKAAEAKVRQEFDEIAGRERQEKKIFLGYPANLDSRLTGFYSWYLDSGLATTMMNNAGNPFGEEHTVGTFSVEKKVIAKFARHFGFDSKDYWGLVTTGGTDGNNHGIYFGNCLLQKQSGQKPVFYVSDQAHYSNMRLAHLQGLEVRIVPADVRGAMDLAAFEQALDPSRPVLVVCALGTTFKGGTDNLPGIDQILRDKKVRYAYRHVDAALFGGYLPFTDCRNEIDQSILGYDSVAVSGHKFFGVDEACGIFVCCKSVFDAQKQSTISYLDDDMPMISCSRSALAPLKLYWLIEAEGEDKFVQDAQRVLDNAKYLHHELDKIGWPSWRSKYSNTVYFKNPGKETVHRFILAEDFDERLGGALAHVVVMQHVNKELLDRFVDSIREVVSRPRS